MPEQVLPKVLLELGEVPADVVDVGLDLLELPPVVLEQHEDAVERLVEPIEPAAGFTHGAVRP